ncbi:MAG: hypothetical protein EOP07_00910 [Proteobacteria bacterium]|nr:MAG: hypothetical protein EOP07_00910 [Pseudomonadota bacterium]
MKNLICALGFLVLSSSAFAANTQFEREAAANAAPTEEVEKTSCILGNPENLDAQLVLTASPESFSIYTPSSTGHTIEIVYEKSEIYLFMAPSEAPILECASDKANIVVWERIALINGQYFSLENATSIHND